MTRAVVLAAAIALGACAPEAPESWHVDDPELVGPAQAAAEAWCAATDREWCPLVDDPSGASIDWAPVDNPMVCATYTWPTGRIEIMSDGFAARECMPRDPATGAEVGRFAALTASIAPELGHGYTVPRGRQGHLDTPHATMHSPVWYWAGAPTAEDVDYVLGR